MVKYGSAPIHGEWQIQGNALTIQFKYTGENELAFPHYLYHTQGRGLDGVFGECFRGTKIESGQLHYITWFPRYLIDIEDVNDPDILSGAIR